MRYIMLLLCAALVGASPGAQPTALVTIKNDAYFPARLTVAAGATVTFVNKDDDAHTVTSATGAFDSKGLDTNDSWRHRFTKPGTYAYFCELHPFMKATIVVKAGKP